MFEKAIFARDVRKGDIVRFGDVYTGSPVASVEHATSSPWVTIHCENGGGYPATPPDRIFSLIHRPWPEGKTDEKWRKEIEALLLVAWRTVEEANWEQISDYGRSDQCLARLREALDVYELGKPLKSEK